MLVFFLQDLFNTSLLFVSLSYIYLNLDMLLDHAFKII